MVPTRKLPLCRCTVLAFRSFSFSASLFFSFFFSFFFSLPLPPSFTLQLELQLFTLRRRATCERNSSREKWTRGCLMAPRRCRYRFIRADVVFHECSTPSRRDAIERNVHDVRNVGYFLVRRIVRLFFSLLSFFSFFFWKKNKKPSFFGMHWNYIVFLLWNYVKFFITTFFAFSLARLDFGNTAKEMEKVIARLFLFSL